MIGQNVVGSVTNGVYSRRNVSSIKRLEMLKET